MHAFYLASYAVLSPLIRATWRVRRRGVEHVPRSGPVILASNHLSFLDHFVTGAAVRRQLFFISKVEHFESPVKRWFFRRWGVIPLKRGSGDEEAWNRSVEVLQRGEAFIIYPEGTRSLDGKLHRGRTGVARLALQTQAPVVPVACLGTFEALPKGKSMPRFNRVEVRFGPPLDFGHYAGRDGDPATCRRVTDAVMREIAALSGQEYVDEYQFNPEYATKEAQGEAKPAEAKHEPTLVAVKRPKRGAAA